MPKKLKDYEFDHVSVRAALLRKKITIKEAAERWGVSLSTLQKWLSGRHRAPVEFLALVLEEFGGRIKDYVKCNG